MNWLQFGVQWLHVLLGITWFGFGITMYFFVAPALVGIPEGQQRATSHRIGEIGGRVFPIVALLVLLLGILRGTVFGPIQSVEALFGTAYGITWLIALIATVAIIVNGARFIAPTFRSLSDTSDFPAAAARLRRLSGIDLALFGVAFTCMILMRFGY